MEKTKKCPECGGKFEEGNLHTNGVLLKWGQRAGLGLSFWIKEKDRREIVSYRCSNCGYLKTYAK